MKTFKQYFDEEIANSVGGGGVDMNPTGYAKRDKRKKYDTEKMYRRNLGLSKVKETLKP